MINLNIYDNENVYSHSIEVDEFGAMPNNSTTKELPTLVNDEVARWTGTDWIVLTERPEPIIDISIPHSITMRQTKIALHSMDKLSEVETAVSTMDEVTKIEWASATVIEYNNELVSNMCIMLEVDKNEFFNYANTL